MPANPRKIRKAAVLIASLDREAADIVMNQMTPLQARLVRRAMVELGSPDPVEQNDVIEDFFRTAPRVRRDDLDGLELGDDLLSHVAPPPAADRAAHHDLPTMGRDSSPLHFLKNTAIGPLAPLLERERPQTIAVVLSHLSPESSAELLGRLPAALQVEVTHCMMGLDQIDATALRALEDGVAVWLAQHAQVQDFRGDAPLDGRAAVKRILGTASAETRRNMLAALPEEPDTRTLPATPVQTPATQPEPAGFVSLQAPLVAPPAPIQEFDFTQFCQLSPLSAASIIAEAYPEVAALALVGADATFAEQVLEQMPPGSAAAIQTKMQDLGPTALADVELAQNEIARLAEHRQARQHSTSTPSTRLSVVG